MLKTALLLTCSAVLWTGCAPKPEVRIVTKVEEIRPQIPPQLTDCAPSPEVGIMETQADVAAYILDLFEAHADCAERLRALNAVFR